MGKSSFGDLRRAYEALVNKHFGSGEDSPVLVGAEQVAFRKEESELFGAHGWTRAEYEATRDNTQATNWLLALVTGGCHPLEPGVEVREDGENLVVTLPEETSTGEVRFAEYRVSISRI